MTLDILTTYGEMRSKVSGRVNWVIRIELADKRATVGGKGRMTSRNLMSERVSYIAKHGTTWEEFTYRVDLEEAMKELEEQGFSITWLQ